MPPIRVLVVDDSVVIRKVLCDVLASDPAIEVAGTASDGRIALAKITQLTPDLITLDVEMPNLSGLETIAEIRKLHPKLPIIMFSTLTERGASTTLDALALGASDYVTKPSNTGSLEVTMARIKHDLLPKIKALCGRRLSDRALAELLPAIPADFPVPIVIVQHMPPLFTRMLAERLNKQCLLRVHEGESGKTLEPGHAWIAPGDHHMIVERHGTKLQLALNQAPPENSCRPAVDVLFRSVAGVFGANTLAVVLTGMGSDGVRGSQVVRERGGRVYVQDEATSVVWGMPGQTAAGWADSIYPLQSMATEIDRHVRASRQPASPLPKLVPSNSS